MHDMALAASRIAEATAGVTFAAYEKTWLLQSAVERQLGVIGEALARVRQVERGFYDRFADADKIVGLRNIIVHGYDVVDPRVLWSIIAEKLPALMKLVDDMLREAREERL
ncbi:MAG: DUF86 domain-containing protein [Fimbriimonas ginsengisoli]|uniref:DUF86 domain-containing protein n=1 Tax=Fimbriimonas ginsengisoli TaxID=1005039 RepID=A0A931LU16_FIMGI|nr:DUF86 domain-containing protein [Fimbriimonas ginsengisoli]